MTRLLRHLAIAVAASLAALAGACSPCAGIVGCADDAPHVSASGILVRHADGKPVAGATVRLEPTSGVHVTGTLVATTDAAGAFDLVAPTDAAGDVVADLVVTPPPPSVPYRVSGVRLVATTRRGEGTILGRLLADPYIFFIGELHDRRSGQPLGGATVYVVPHAGSPLGRDTIATSTDGSGRFIVLPGVSVTTDVVVDLLVFAPGVASGTVVPNVRLTPIYRDAPPGVAAVFQVGTSLDYFGEILFRGTRRLVTNTSVTFRRTGGLAIAPSAVTVPIDASGRFKLSLAPSGTGVVIGDLTFTPPNASAPVTISNVRLATYDSVETRLQQFAFGQQLLYAGEVIHKGTLLRQPGVAVEFRRTGGIATSPVVDTSITDANGRFRIAPATSDSGDVIGDLVLRPPGDAPVTYTGVRLSTFASDTVRFAGVWGVGEHVLYSVEIWSNTTRTRAGAGIPVTFRRTGGIALLSDTITAVTGTDGRALLFPKTTQRGEVVGELVIQSPPPFAPTVVPNVRLATFATDDVRFAGIFGYGPSLLYVGEVLRADNDRPVAGAQVSFVRTGGAAASPSQTTAVTDGAGRFPLGLVPQANGEVIGTVTIVPPAPWAQTPIVFTNVRAATFDTGELRLLTVFRISAP